MVRFVKSDTQSDGQWHFIQDEEKHGSLTYVTACKEHIETTAPHQTAKDGNVVQKHEAEVCPACGF